MNTNHEASVCNFLQCSGPSSRLDPTKFPNISVIIKCRNFLYMLWWFCDCGILTLRKLYRSIHIIQVVHCKNKKLFITDQFLTKNAANRLGYCALRFCVVWCFTAVRHCQTYRILPEELDTFLYQCHDRNGNIRSCLEKWDNRHCEAEGLNTQHVGSRWDTSDIHVVTSDRWNC
jgi:hypothetical protein